MDQYQNPQGNIFGQMKPSQEQEQGQMMPGQMMPGQVMPGQMMPGQMMPGQTMPGQMMPGQMMPGQMMPGQTMPGQMMPGQMTEGQATIENEGAEKPEIDADEPFSEKAMLQKLAEGTNMSFVDLEVEEIDPMAVKCANEKIARTHNLIPFALYGNDLHVAMADPLDFQAIDDLKVTSGKHVVPHFAVPGAIQTALDRFFRTSEESEAALQDLSGGFSSEEGLSAEELAASAEIDNAPIVRIVKSIFVDAINMKTSDIHIEPFEKEIRVRFRVDGELREIMKLPPQALSGIVTRIKIMADLNIAETKRPQDGRVKMEVNNYYVNMRISLIPAIYGEKVVIRILNTETGVMDMKDIGLSEFNFNALQKLMKISEGIILVTGPTGSGKSTTLYSVLNEFNTINRNIITLEDPVENQLFGINQVQVNSKIGMTFASGLRSILRQDPDIIMLGEIRDEETAEIAIRSAVTGHVVLSTLHTNDTASTISRLSDMGIAKYMVTSAVAGVLAQRLLKRICKKCAYEYQATEQEKEMLGVTENVMLKKGAGCPTCNNSGYKGRIGIHETLVMDAELKTMINNNCSMDELKEAACKKGMKTLQQSAIELVLQGITTMDEMVKATYNVD